jgi:hypothetical protein
VLIQSYTLALTGDAFASSYEKRSANRVETDGRHAKPGGTETETGTEDNVVRLPRDWLGPREDLIPFGPSAEAEDDGLATPPSTHDFWGEAGSHLWEPDPDHPALAASRRLALAGWVRPDALSRSIARLTDHPRAAWFSAMAVSCLAILVVALGGSENHRRASTAVRRHAPSPTSVAKLSPGRALPSLQSRPRHASARRSSRGTHRAKPLAKHRTVHRTGKRLTRSATVQGVRYTPPAASSKTTSSSSTPPTSSSPASNPPATAASRSSGSTNQPALGAAGALGPGSSPDS